MRPVLLYNCKSRVFLAFIDTLTVLELLHQRCIGSRLAAALVEPLLAPCLTKLLGGVAKDL